MASLPPQRSSQRRSSPSRQQSTSADAPSSQRADSQSPSTKSIDSQTLLLNDPSHTSPKSEDRPEQQTSISQSPKPSEPEPRKCWICFQDETEDGPDASPWRTPCPCALTAHESCLLDWVADMEAPDTSRSTAAPKQIKCPQCKSEIRLARPRSFVVESVNKVERLTAQLLLPGVVAGLSYGMYIISSHHGAFTIRMIFGREDANAILTPSRHISFIEHHMRLYAPAVARPFFRSWRGARLELGLPLIPAALIASRTTLADALLPILPIVFFATHPEHSQELTHGLWPPSAALTLVILPYMRGIYDEYLERVWGARERQWMKEIRLRLGEEGHSTGEQDANDDLDNDDADVVEVELDIEMDSEDEEDEENNHEGQQRNEQPNSQEGGNDNQPAEAPAPREPGDDVPALDAPVADPAQREQIAERERELRHEAEVRVNDLAQRVEEAAHQNEHRQNDHQHHHHHRQQIDLVASATRIAGTSLGALAFPAISAAMGEALRVLLPASLVVPGYVGRRAAPTGLLQTRWGRSILGGCLFVVLKDAVRIYCRWKMAQTFKRRRVQDYDKSLGKVVHPA